MLEPFRQRIRCRGHSDFRTYLQRLAEADIGLMVLEPGPFTDAKSPNRWMECSLMGVATVLSPIRSCTDLLEEGEHTLFARQPQAWVDQINLLINPRNSAWRWRSRPSAMPWQLGSDRAAELWAPLLQLEQTTNPAHGPDRRTGQANRDPGPPDRLANALAQAAAATPPAPSRLDPPDQQ